MSLPRKRNAAGRETSELLTQIVLLDRFTEAVCDFGHSIANSSAVSENVAFKTKYSAGEHHEKEAGMPDGKLHLLILQILCPSFPPAVRRAGCAQG